MKSIEHRIRDERKRQTSLWGDQKLPNGTGGGYVADSVKYRDKCNEAAVKDSLTWADVLLEEVYEALAESDPRLLTEELIQVAAVCVAIIENIEREPNGS